MEETYSIHKAIYNCLHQGKNQFEFTSVVKWVHMWVIFLRMAHYFSRYCHDVRGFIGVCAQQFFGITHILEKIVKIPQNWFFLLKLGRHWFCLASVCANDILLIELAHLKQVIFGSKTRKMFVVSDTSHNGPKISFLCFDGKFHCWVIFLLNRGQNEYFPTFG